MLTRYSGFKPGEITILVGSNRSGKSFFYSQEYLNAMNKAERVKFKKFTEAIVDGEQWYTVSIGNDLLHWLKTQDPTRYKLHTGERYITTLVDMHYSIYTMGLIKWA